MATNNTKIVITAEDKTAAAFASAKEGLDKFSAAYAALGGLAGVGLVAAVSSTVRATINLGDEMNDLSQKVGIGIKDLATWKLAAEQSGTSLESVARGVKGLSTYMVNYGDSLRKAGITSTDANGALTELADVFAAMPDGVEKTALAVQLFGKAGMEMIPMLNLGSKGLGEAQQKAEEYGRRMAELAPKADAFNDQVSELLLNMRALGINIADFVIEPLTNMAVALNNIAAGGAKAEKQIAWMADQGHPVAKAVQAWAGVFKSMGIGETRSMGYTGPKNAAGLPMSELEQFDAATEKYMKDRAAIGRGRAIAATSKAAGSGASAKTSRGIDDENDVIYRIQEDQRQKNRKAYDEADKARERDVADLEKLRNKYIALADPLQKYREQLDEIEKLKQLGREAGGLDAAQALEAAMRVNDAMDSEIAKINEVGNAGKDAFADLATAIEGWGNKAADTFADFVVDGKASFGDLVNSILKDIVRLQAKQVLDPITKGASSWLTSAVGNMFGGSSGADVGLASGGVMSGAGISAYSGSVVSRPTLFPFAHGIGLMGEAGAEAILPLKRGSDGKLGVQGGSGGGVTVNIIEDSSRGGQVQSRTGSNGQNVLDVFVDRVRAAVAGDIVSGSGMIPAALGATYGLNRAAGGY